MAELLLAGALKLAQRLTTLVAAHLGWAIWAILVVGIVLALGGAVLSDYQEWRVLPANHGASVWDMLTSAAMGPAFERIVDRAIEAIGIEIIGAALVAIAFLLTRDATSETLERLEHTIDQLRQSQAQLIELLTQDRKEYPRERDIRSHQIGQE